MKRRLVLFLTAVIIVSLSTVLLIHNQPVFVFFQGDNHVWNIIRSLFLSIMLAAMVTGLLSLVLHHKQIKPYFEKFLKFQPLLRQLVRRDFLSKYKRSVLGVLWSLLNPLMTMLVLTAIFSTLFRFDIDNFPVYLLSGQIIFTMYSEVTNLCLSSITCAATLMKKVSVPKYIFPLSRSLSSLINFAFSFVALILVMVVTKAPFNWCMLYTIVPVFYAFMFSTGIGLLLSALMVFFRDISYLYGIFMTAVMYFTPLFYPISIVPEKIRWIISLNPLYHFVSCFRSCAIYGVIPSVWQNIICFALAASALCAGLLVFSKKQDQFILYV